MSAEIETPEKLSKKLADARNRLRFVEEFIEQLVPLLSLLAENPAHPQQEAIKALMGKVKNAKGNVGNHGY